MVSIVIPLFNYADLVRETIESIISQSYQDWEIIVVNDGSTDNPRSVIDEYLSDKIKCIDQENRGYGAAKNVGIRASSGEFLVVLDADDMLTKDSLRLRVKYLMGHPNRQWVIAKAFEFTGVTPPYDFKVINRKATRRLSRIMKTKDYTDLWKSIHAQTVMVSRSVYEKVGLYEESLPSRGDKEMWARIINNVGIPGYINREVAYYRHHGNQMHRSAAKKKNLPKLQKKLEHFIKKRKNGNFEGVPML